MKTVDEIKTAMDAIVDPAKAEGRTLTNEEVDQYADLEKELAAVRATLEVSQRHAAYSAPITGFPAVIKPQPKGDDAEMAAFSAYLRTGIPNGDISHLRRAPDGTFAQTEGAPTAGGYAVPDTFLTRLTESRSSFGGFMPLGEQLTTSDGRPLAWPSKAAEVSTAADIAAEGASSAAGADVVFGEVTLGAYRYAATGTGNIPVKVSVELLQDATFDVAALVARLLGERIRRKQAYDLVRGSGSSEPLGIMYGTAGDEATTTGASMVPTYAQLNDLKHDLDPAYREMPGCGWLMNDTTLGVLENIVDAQGRPIIAGQSQGIEAAPSNGRLLGFPITIDAAVPDGANDVQFIGFGHWQSAYIVRHVRDVQVLVNPYAATGYIVYDAWARMDGNVQDASAYVTMEGLT